MAQTVKGKISSLSSSQKKDLERLFHRRVAKDEIVSVELGRELYEVAAKLSQTIGVLITREGRIVEVIAGSREILYLPDLGRHRLGKGRLRGLRLVFSDLSNPDEAPHIPADIYTDLEKLRLDMVVGVKISRRGNKAVFAHILPFRSETEPTTKTEVIQDLGRYSFDFASFISELENEIRLSEKTRIAGGELAAVIVGVHEKPAAELEESLDELVELASTAGIKIVGRILQKRKPDPKTLLGKGKLEEVILQCLRLGAEMIIFDAELRPTQWRIITNSTELKIIDRSMLILDIFAQRASSSDGRLQVELAQLKYNLPRLTERDAGLSRLTGGIGGRGPGETKLEIGRRRSRDKINELEKRISTIEKQRGLRRKRRQQNKTPVVSILGYTNVGKSTLFNALTNSEVTAENKLFATLDPTSSKIQFPPEVSEEEHRYVPGLEVVISDTVGFIRDLPEELVNAFRATLEELNQASLLLHVVDISDPRAVSRVESVEKILREMDLGDIPVIMVLNKVDRLSREEAQVVMQEFRSAEKAGCVLTSAKENLGLKDLLELIKDYFKNQPGDVTTEWGAGQDFT